jgi:hypothetical protein
MLRRATVANVRFYAALADLSVKYVQNLGEILTASPAQADTTGTPPGRPPQAAASLVLEGAAGTQAQGFFLVENRLTRAVSAKPVASSLADPAGGQIEARIRFEPEEISLPPNGKLAVQVSVGIDDKFKPGVGYRGTITVPGLTEGGAAFIVRRTEPVASRASKKKAKRS